MRQDNATRSVKPFEIHDEAIRISSADHIRSFLQVSRRKVMCSPYIVISVQTTEHEALPCRLIHLHLHFILHLYIHSHLFLLILIIFIILHFFFSILIFPLS
jgi:hypothetical protein